MWRRGGVLIGLVVVLAGLPAAPSAPTSISVSNCLQQCVPVATSTLTPTFSGVATDPDSANLTYKLSVRLTGTTTVLTTLTGSTVSPGSVGSVTVPAGVLADATEYDYSLGVTDGTTLRSAPWTAFQTVVGPDVPVTVRGFDVSSGVTFGPEGSPYVLRGRVRVLPGGVLNVLPGTVVKAGGGYLTVEGGQLVADGTGAAPIYMTSLKDDSVGGDSGRDGPTVGAAGDYGSLLRVEPPLEVAADAPTSIVDNVSFRYGGGPYVCLTAGMVKIAGEARVHFTRSEFLDSTAAGIEMPGAAVGGIGSVSVERSLFDRSACAINATGARAQIVANLMADSGHPSLYTWTTGAGANGVVAKDNYFYGPVSLTAEVTPTRGNLNFVRNAFYNGVEDQTQSRRDHEDLSGNFWLFSPNHVDPVGCAPQEGSPPHNNPVMIPEVKTRYNTTCPSRYEIYDDFTLIRPFSQPPPVVPVGLQSDPALPVSVQPGQLLGLGDGQFAMNPSGFQGDPVNTANGSFVEQTVDAALPITGDDLVLARTYNSADQSVGPLGQGWSSTLATRLAFPADGVVTLTSGDGQQSQFFASTGNSYTSGPGVTAELTRNSDGTFDAASRAGMTFRFGSAGRLLDTRDVHGNGWDFSYDAQGRLERVDGATGSRGLDVSWTGDRITRVELPDGRWVGYTYTDGPLTQVRDLAGHTETYEYDASGRVVTKTDKVGQQSVRLAYNDATGRVSDQWDARDRHSTFAWNDTSKVATMTDPRGGTWIDTYADGVLTKRRDPLSRTWTYEYDADLRMVTATDPRGFRSRMSYDAGGNMVSSSTSRGTTLAEFDPDHNPTKTTNPRGFTTTNSYAANGDLIQSVQRGMTGQTPRITTFEYSPRGFLQRTVDPEGIATELEYNAEGDLTKVTSPASTITYDYDVTGRRIAENPRPTAADGPDAYRTSFTYDDADRLARVEDPLGRESSTTHDHAGRPLTMEDFAGRATRFTYLPDGRVAAIQGPDPAVAPTTFDYDDNGNQTKVTDPSGRVESTGYDAANQATTRTTPIGTTTVGYNQGGHPTTVTRPGNQIIRYSYTATGQVRLIDYPTGTTDVSFGYDANGNRTSMTQGSRAVAYTYDGFDALTSVKVGTGLPYTYSYTPGGQVASVAPPIGPATTLSYDPARRLHQVLVGGQTRATYTYTPTGRVATAGLGDGSTRTYTYDAADRLTRLQDVNGTRSILDEQISYDNVDNPTAITHADLTTDTYSYDALDRLTGVCYDASVCDEAATDFVRWTYDAVGNRTSETRPEGTTNYSVSAATGQLLSTSGPGAASTFTYNARGELTTKTVGSTSTTYGYDATGRVLSETSGSNATNYTYDGDGRRLTMVKNPGSNPTTTGFVWDPLSYELTAETNSSGAATRTYAHGLGPISITDSAASATSYLHADIQGTVRETTSPAGATTSTAEFEPFGVPRAPTTAAQGLGWAGQYADPTGTTHLRARQYDPTIGAFLTPDPAGATLPGATYTYADSNPMTGSDPLGLWTGFSDSWDTLGYVGQNILGLTPLGDIAYAFGECTSEKGSCGADVVAGAALGAAGVGAAGYGAYKGLKALRASNAGDDAVQLFRHAGPEELADLRATGAFNLGRNSTGKYFADNAEDATKWGDWLNGGQGGVVSTRVPRSFADQMMRWEKLDGIGPARFSSPEQLNTLNRAMSRIEFW
jgi:RHS repeat-associated protein